MKRPQSRSAGGADESVDVEGAAHESPLVATQLTSNGSPLVSDTNDLGVLRAYSDGLSDHRRVRERYDEDGYLLCRALLDRSDVLALRSAYFSAARSSGEPPGPLTMSGPEMVPHGVAGHRAHSFVRTPEFQAFTSIPALRDVAAVILACEPRLLPRQILREYSPGSNRASRAHTDHVYINRGTKNVVTAWIPIGDCSLASGSLVYLEGSHHLQPDELDAVRAVTDRSDPRRLSHDLGWVARRLGRRWLVGDYRAGDVVFHSPHMIHATLDVSGTMPRLSTDVRFIPATEEADERWLETWSGDDGN